jgi:hypothetical protein
VNTSKRLRAGRSAVRNPAGTRDFLFSKTSTTAPRPPNSCIQWGGSVPEAKYPGREVGHLPPSGAEVRNERRYTSPTPPPPLQTTSQIGKDKFMTLSAHPLLRIQHEIFLSGFLIKHFHPFHIQRINLELTLISSFRHDVDATCVLLGYYAASCGICVTDWLSFRLGLLILEDGTNTLPRNVGKQFPHDAT